MTTLASQSHVGLATSLTRASAFVTIGVIALWLYIKLTAQPITVELPEVAAPIARSDAQSSLELAAQAFAAGRMLPPAQDNALELYAKAALRSPGDEAAVGLRRTIDRVLTDAESALHLQDWTSARRILAHVLSVDSSNARARSIETRLDQLETLQQLARRATEQLAANRLTQPTGDNAVATYRDMLRIAPTNVQAQRGLDRIAERFLSSAQSHALSGNTAAAEAYLAKAESVAPTSSEIAVTQSLIGTLSDLAVDNDVHDDLTAAAAALQDGRLSGPGDDNALAHFRSAAQKRPGSEAAASGIVLVEDALVRRIQSHIDQGDSVQARVALDTAERALSDRSRLAPLRDAITRLENPPTDAQPFVALSDLEVIATSYPSFPGSAKRKKKDGWVKLSFTIDDDGRVDAVETIASSDLVFEGPSARALRRWRFKPYVIDGAPIPVRANVQFTFVPE